MAFLILSWGMEFSRAFCMANRSLRFASGLPPPLLAATMISLASLVNRAPLSASILPFLRRMLCHFECPDTEQSSCAHYSLETIRDYSISQVGGQTTLGSTNLPRAA